AGALQWPVAPEEVAAEVAGFLQPARAEPPPTHLPADIAEWARTTWQWLSDRAAGREARVDLAPVRAGLLELAERVGPVLAERTRRQRLEAEQADADTARLLAERDRVHALFESSQ